jgi:hypothetical protein
MMDKEFHCDYQQFGTAHITFNSSSLSHHIRITYPDGGHREKPVEAGKQTDTLELKPGSYQLAIYSLDNNADTLKTEIHPIAITVCDEMKITADL